MLPDEKKDDIVVSYPLLSKDIVQKTPPPSKKPTKVISNARRSVQRQVLGDVIRAHTRRLLRSAVVSWRKTSGLPKRTPSAVLAEVEALADRQVDEARHLVFPDSPKNDLVAEPLKDLVIEEPPASEELSESLSPAQTENDDDGDDDTYVADLERKVEELSALVKDLERTGSESTASFHMSVASSSSHSSTWHWTRKLLAIFYLVVLHFAFFLKVLPPGMFERGQPLCD